MVKMADYVICSIILGGAYEFERSKGKVRITLY